MDTYRYSTLTQTAPNSLANILQFISSSVRSPMLHPPSWYIMMSGLPPCGGPDTGWYTLTRIDAASFVATSCSVSFTVSGMGPGMG